MTTLELAEQIALAVGAANVKVGGQAVLQVLHETGHWFCAVDETPNETILTPMPQLPFAEPAGGGRPQ